MTVGILGAGAFGTSLSIALSTLNKKLILWTQNHGTVKSIQELRENRLRLPGYILPEQIIATNDIEESLKSLQPGSWINLRIGSNQYIAFVNCCLGTHMLFD